MRHIKTLLAELLEKLAAELRKDSEKSKTPIEQLIK